MQIFSFLSKTTLSISKISITSAQIKLIRRKTAIMGMPSCNKLMGRQCHSPPMFNKAKESPIQLTIIMIATITTIDDINTEVVDDTNTTISIGMIVTRPHNSMKRQQLELNHKRANVQILVGVPGDKK